MNLDEIQQIFFQECEEGLATMEAAFAVIRDGAHDGETINTVFRSVHSIKGGAGAFGHERLQAYTHEYETLLDQVRNGTLALTPPLLTVILAAFDMLADHVAAARDQSAAPADAAMLERLVAAAGGNAGDAVSEAPPAAAAPAAADDFDDLMALLGDVTPAADPGAPWTLTVCPATEAFENGAEPLLLLRELTRLGAQTVAADLSRLPDLDVMECDRAYLAWTLHLPATVAEDEVLAVFDFTDGYTIALERGEPAPTAAPDPVAAAPVAAPPAPPPAPPPAAKPVEAVAVDTPAPAPAAAQTPAQTIRVDLDKLDRLVNLVGELVITQAMLTQRLTDCGLAGCSELSDLDHLTRELQESVMALRAQPMKTVFSRVPRIIRELETETGKRVRLETDGEMTEVDKTVCERIGEPLTHLIRNAVDHGLEGPEERAAAGKSAEGVVRLSAAHHSGRIVITVADDGRGIDRERVRAKAVERGIILPDAILGDEDVDNLIFAPGFSTATTVSNISGRGVGMDVVRKNVQALGGRISIQSHFGRGSSFSLSLPLTLAVLDGMVVTVRDQTFVIPLSHIVESLRPEDGAVTRIGTDGAVLDVRGSYVPVHDIGERLGVTGPAPDPGAAVLIVVDGDHGPAALMVDTILDQRQVVVKSLEANYQAVEGLAGATILGNGRVALILDVDALTARRRPESRSALANLAVAA